MLVSVLTSGFGVFPPETPFESAGGVMLGRSCHDVLGNRLPSYPPNRASSAYCAW